MKTGMEEFKKRISVGNFFSSAILIVAAYSFFARVALDYVKSLKTTTFVTSALLAVSAVIVVFMMRSTPYFWTDYRIYPEELAEFPCGHIAQDRDFHCGPDARGSELRSPSAGSPPLVRKSLPAGI
jgi:hypothetical protein